jgi:hypothetical protein
MESNYDRSAVIARIKTALERRSGKRWSVTGGRGTAYGWLEINAPPARRTWSCRLKAGAVTDWPEDFEEFDSGTPGGNMSPNERKELANLLGLEHAAHCQGVSIPASHRHYQEYIDRAEGRPAVPTPAYWD